MAPQLKSKLFYVVLFGIAMGYFESALVVYLRELFYPEGFAFPIKEIPQKLIIIELFRELATILMLISIAALAGKKLWERFAYFILIFGIWDIWYYIFLKITINWPATLFDWDILFLIPLPWIAPVIAPVLISFLMIILSILIINLYADKREFKPALLTWLLAILATGFILFSFMHDLDATLRLQYPQPYMYWLLISGLTLYIAAFVISYKTTIQKR